ncbi:MAG TPA: sigma factor [Bacilli bacterium]|nr:sigma factor [Bacilli bacterium]HPL58977.1 sigma factor [Bacilli bacterium]
MKVLRRLLLITVLAIGGIMLAGCRTNTAKPAAKNQEDVVSYSVVSGLEMLSAGSARKLSLDADAQDEQVITNDLDEINDYLGLVEKFLSSDDAAITHTEGASERDGFEKKMTISTMNLTGERTEYVLYYNETSVDVEEDDDELEVEIELEGIVVLGDVEYTLTGEKEIEQEEGEEEYSYKFEIKLDSKNWVKIEYSEELEDDEVEKSFKYEAYNNGVKKEIKIAYENEDDELKLKLYISDELELEIKQEKNELKIEYETKDPETGKKVEGEIKVRVVTDANGNTSYEYKVKEKNGGEVTYQKDRDEDEDAFVYIYNQTKAAVYSVVMNVLHDRTQTEDVMQEVYITMVKSINSYQENGKFLSWLLTIAKNKAIDIIVVIRTQRFCLTQQKEKMNIY